MRPTAARTPRESTVDVSSAWDSTPSDTDPSPWWRLALAAALAVVAIAATASLLA